MRRKRKLRKVNKQKSFLVRYFYSLFVAPLAIVLILLGFGFFTKNNNFCANSISCIKNLTGEYEKGQTAGTFLGKSVFAPTEIAYQPMATRAVLGNTNLKKHIEVDLSTQRLYAFEGDKLVYTFLVSTGKWAPTPTGVFNIWVKLRYTRMEGGDPSIGTYYNLPNVPYVMFFYSNEVPKSRGFSLHGAYWHNNFGHPMSHGCVNMRPEDAAVIYEWADPPTTGNMTYAQNKDEGTQITIYGVAPAD